MMLLGTPDSELGALTERFENQIKNLKKEIYQISWYMRGGISTHDLLHETDIGDLEIFSLIIKENIESTKKSGMPLI